MITDMLSGVVKEGTGRRAQVINRPIAGKTGTTNQYKDVLFIGFSPSIVTGVWVGQDKSETLGDKETEAKAALPIWIAIMAKALKDYPLAYFDIPVDIVKVRIDPARGNMVSDRSISAVNALFKKGTEPAKYQ